VKTCNKCSEEKSLSEFYKRKGGKDGLRCECKKCHTERQKQYYQTNKEVIVEQRKQYRQANKETIAERQKQYHQANKEKITEQQKQYRQANKEKITEQRKQYRQASKEVIAERQKQYYQTNKEVLAERRKQYYQANKEKITEQQKQHYQANKEVIAERHKQYCQDLPAGIYVLENKKTGTTYIGQSTMYQHRKASHFSRLRNNKHENKRLQEDYNKYGDVFDFRIVEELPSDTPIEILLKKEMALIDKYISESKELYNIADTTSDY
jgi:hypothetical protein